MSSKYEQDGQVPDAQRQADILAIQDLAICYGHAIDDGDFDRYEALWLPDAHIDYRSAGGIEGKPAEIAAWLPASLAPFTWSLHSIFSHEIRFTGSDTASGRCHLFARQGIEWKGKPELVDVSGLYLDEYRRLDGRWQFSRREEKTISIEGGSFAALVRANAPGVSG